MCKETVCRKDDEFLYQPQIHSRHVRKLYAIKRETGIPMTVLVDQAVRELVSDYEYDFELQDEPDSDISTDELWEEYCEYIVLLNEIDCDEYLNQTSCKTGSKMAATVLK